MDCVVVESLGRLILSLEDIYNIVISFSYQSGPFETCTELKGGEQKQGS